MTGPISNTLLRTYTVTAIASLMLLYAGVPTFGQSFVYTNDGQGANSVSGFSADASGKLTTITGSPFLTKGQAGGVRLGSDFTANRVVATSAGNHLFASNDSDGTISAFSVNPANGVLTLVSGSPFPGLGVCNAGYSLAVTPDGKTLVAGTLCGTALQVYNIASSGALSVQSSGKLAGCKAGGATGSMKTTSDSGYVAVANPTCASIEVFSLSGGGLAAVTGSPFALAANASAANSVEINCANTTLYAAGAPPSGGKSSVDAFAMSNGVLSRISGAPFFGGLATSGFSKGQPVDFQSATLTTNDQYLVISGWGSAYFSAFSVGSGGSLSEVKGSPFQFGDLSPAQVIPSADGKYIYFAEDTGDPSVLSGVGVLAIDGSGNLTQIAGSPFRNPRASFVGGNNAVAAFPPKVCRAAGPAVSVSPNPIVINTSLGKTGTQTVTITNTGSSTLNIQNLQISNTFGDDITNCFSAAIAPGSNCQMTVTYTATTNNGVTGFLTITDNAPDSPQSIPISATANAGPVLTALPGSLAFSAPLGGASAPQTVTLQNTGGANLTVLNIKLRDDSTGFVLDLTSCFNRTLKPQDTCSLPVTFRPGSSATIDTAILVTNDGTPNPVIISLRGQVSMGGFTLSPSTINFRDTVVGTSSPKVTVTVTSSGTAPATLASASISNSGDYQFLDSTCTSGPMSPGASCQYQLEFHPGSTGKAPQGTFTVQGDSPVANGVTLNGTGITKSQCVDTDGDGLCDDWETYGLTARVAGADVFVDLPAMGADPKHKDVFVHVDYMKAGGSAPHSHQYTPAVMAAAIKAFLNAPLVNNPDGTGGIHLHVDCGPTCVMNPVTGATWGKLSNVTAIGETSYSGVDANGNPLKDSKGNPIVDKSGKPLPVIAISSGGSLKWSDVYALPTNYAATGRLLAFHHAIAIHRMAVSGFDAVSTGQSNNDTSDYPLFTKMHKGASDLVMATGVMGASPSATFIGNTLMHELGHNLGLGHGGEDYNNYKPNYLSIMNYSFDLYGLVENSNIGYTDYSRFALPSIDENNLYEAPGIQGPTATDGTIYGTEWFCPGDATANGTNNIVNNANSNIPWDCPTTLLVPGKTNPYFTYNNGVDYTKRLTIDLNGDGKLTTLNSYTDWDNLVFNGGALSGNGALTGNASSFLPALEVGAEPAGQKAHSVRPMALRVADGEVPTPLTEITVDQITAHTPPNGVILQHPSLIQLVAGGSADVTMVLINNGSTPDTYNLTANVVAGWMDAGGLPGSVSLQPGASATLHVRVSVPASAKVGDQQLVGVLAASPNTPSLDSGDITVEAVATANPISLSTDDLVLGLQYVGQTGSPVPVLVTNTGTAPLSIASIAATGDFSQTNTCGNSLAVGASCVIQVVFAPSGEAKQYGTLVINDSAPDSPQIVKLEGTGKNPVTPLAINAAVNAASSQGGPLAPGTLFTLYGLNLANGPAGVVALPLPTQLGGSSITINGQPAGMLYADANQINAQVPFELTPGDGNVLLVNADGRSAIAQVQIGAVSPGIFTIPGTQHAAAQNQDLTPNLAGSPAPAGGIVVIYFTGQGALDQVVATGAASPGAPPANVTAQVTATIGGQPASVVFAGMTPGAVGLAQANVVVPAAKPDGSPLTPGDYPLVLTVGGLSAGSAMISVGGGK